MKTSHAILEDKRIVSVDTTTWAKWFESNVENRIIKRTEVGESAVSTVFLGLNHGFHGKDLWFETLVFGGKLDGEMNRYETYEEAEAGHEVMVERVKTSENFNETGIE